MAPTDYETGLTQERLKSLLAYDPETGLFTWLVRRPNGVRVGDLAGCINAKGYRIIKIGGKAYKASRLAFLYMTGAFPPVVADHESRERADNRWANLRPADYSQNCSNRLVPNRTGFKGVHFRASRNAFEAYIKKDGRRRFLGYFHSATDAAAAYARAASDTFGSYARIA